jgi:hypothetical protein
MIRLHQIIRCCLAVLLCLVVSGNSSFAEAQVGPTTSAPTGSYGLGDVLALSALGGTVPSFTSLSIWNYRRRGRRQFFRQSPLVNRRMGVNRLMS